MLKMLAIATLLVLVWLYRAGEEDKLTIFDTYWWGILGLIGWAYLVSALVYVASKENIYINLLAWLLFLFLCTANHAHWLPEKGVFRSLISPFGDGAMAALVSGGIVASQLFRHFLQRYNYKQTLLFFLGLAAVLLAAGFAVRSIGGISKINATPSWVLICSAITITVFMILYYVCDVLKKTSLFNIIKPAGTNTLLCYLLPYFAYGIPTILALYLPAFLLTGTIGLIKSFAFALLMVAITGWLGKLHVRLKL